jgi:5-formyltetrahydrofolate cyclo-ligase
MMYAPFRDEVDVWPLMRITRSRGKRLILPATVPADHSMILCEVTDPDNQLAVGNYGIMEPIIGRVEEIDVEELELVLVPGLVFDEQAYRVGYGGGYYDRLISRAGRDKTLFVGIAYDFQIVAAVPNGNFDRPLDGLVSERRVLFV